MWMHGLAKWFGCNYLLKLSHENLLCTLASNIVAFIDFGRRRTRMTEQPQKGLVKTFRSALAILKCHKKSVSLNFVETNSNVFRLLRDSHKATKFFRLFD